MGETEGEGKLKAISSGTFFFFLRVCFKEKKKRKEEESGEERNSPCYWILPLLPQREDMERKAQSTIGCGDGTM